MSELLRLYSERAAIRAMQHPTEPMYGVANRMEAKEKENLKSFEVTGFCAHIYEAMILEALK